MSSVVKYALRYVFRLVLRKGVKWALAALPALLLGCSDYPTTQGPPEAMREVYVVDSGHVYTVFLGSDAAPVAVGYAPGDGTSWWTATVDLVYATGGYCVDGN